MTGTLGTPAGTVIFLSLETRDGSRRSNVSRKVTKNPDRREGEIKEGSLVPQGEASGWGDMSEKSIPCPRLSRRCSDHTLSVTTKQSSAHKRCTCVACENKSLMFCTIWCKGRCVHGDTETRKKRAKALSYSVPPQPCSHMHVAAPRTPVCDCELCLTSASLSFWVWREQGEDVQMREGVLLALELEADEESPRLFYISCWSD